MDRNLPGYLFLCLFFLVELQACTGLNVSPRTREIWYPSYSEFRIHNHQLIVFIHGYGGSEDSFEFFPHLVAANPDRTILYFAYDTSLLVGKTASIGVAAAQLRSFLRENILQFIPKEEKIDLVCHSTGCIVARHYILDNPFTHRVRRLVMAAAPSYGAYWAEATSWWKRQLPFAQGDKQIEELKPGSFTLFHLQERWHCLHARHLKKPLDANACKEGRPRDKEGKLEDIFGDVISEEVDKNYRPEDFTYPETMLIVGTNGWDTWGRGKFSDAVVRFESAMFDRRFICLDESSWQGNTCKDPLVMFVDCWHIEFFREDKCGREVLAALNAFLDCREEKGRGCRPNKEKLREIIHYKGEGDGDKRRTVRDYLLSVNIAALWVHMRHQDPADWIEVRDAQGSALDRSAAPLIPFGIYEADILDAVRTSEINDKDKIYYYKYVTVPYQDHEKRLSIKISPAGIGNHISLAQPYETVLRAGMTAVLDCGWEGSRFYCENYTPERRLCFLEGEEQSCL